MVRVLENRLNVRGAPPQCSGHFPARKLQRLEVSQQPILHQRRFLLIVRGYAAMPKGLGVMQSA